MADFLNRGLTEDGCDILDFGLTLEGDFMEQGFREGHAFGLQQGYDDGKALVRLLFIIILRVLVFFSSLFFSYIFSFSSPPFLTGEEKGCRDWHRIGVLRWMR